MMLYGVARISTGKQSIERQVRNITKIYPNAKIIKETFTGTKLEGRKEIEGGCVNIASGYRAVWWLWASASERLGVKC